jgi:catechol 2,3-dioxygenase-like lactoylglutathione lyase family enzyme
VLGFKHHGIIVASIERSLEFLVGVLGLRPDPIIELDEAFAVGITGL